MCIAGTTTASVLVLVTLFISSDSLKVSVPVTTVFEVQQTTSQTTAFAFQLSRAAEDFWQEAKLTKPSDRKNGGSSWSGFPNFHQHRSAATIGVATTDHWSAPLVITT